LKVKAKVITSTVIVTQKLASPKKRAEFEILINTISKKRTLKLLGNKENQVSEMMNDDLADISISFQKQRKP
jgi:hypothetical protein